MDSQKKNYSRGTTFLYRENNHSDYSKHIQIFKTKKMVVLMYPGL